jgi:cytochrome b pre-mRNA-processing protein 3
MIFARWRARRASRALIDHLHGEIVAAARKPALYMDCGVPDTLDGRFEMVVLHGDLLLRRLTETGAGDLAQDVVDRLFEGFDDAFREMSISDAGVVKRMTKFASAYFGRAGVYGPALAAGDESALAAALARNALRVGDGVPAAAHKLAARALATQARLAATPRAAFESSTFRYPGPETAP